MAKRKMAKAKCSYCHEDFTTISMAKHLAACSKHLAAIAKAENGKSKPESLYYIRVVEPYAKDFWLDIEVCGSATMGDLDYYLRAIWLECCGHLSEFSAKGWGSSEIAMEKTIKDVFSKYDTVVHIYDFGTSSETAVKLLGTRQGKPLSKHPIELMARNLMPEIECCECQETSKWLCVQCQNEGDNGGTVCQNHYENHESHDEYGDIVELVNSPRLGMCGYEGPADPPY